MKVWSVGTSLPRPTPKIRFAHKGSKLGTTQTREYALTEPWPTSLPRSGSQRISNISNKFNFYYSTQTLGEVQCESIPSNPCWWWLSPLNKNLVIETLIDLSFLFSIFSLLIGKISAVRKMTVSTFN